MSDQEQGSVYYHGRIEKPLIFSNDDELNSGQKKPQDWLTEWLIRFPLPESRETEAARNDIDAFCMWWIANRGRVVVPDKKDLDQQLQAYREDSAMVEIDRLAKAYAKKYDTRVKRESPAAETEYAMIVEKIGCYTDPTRAKIFGFSSPTAENCFTLGKNFADILDIRLQLFDPPKEWRTELSNSSNFGPTIDRWKPKTPQSPERTNYVLDLEHRICNFETEFTREIVVPPAALDLLHKLVNLNQEIEFRCYFAFKNGQYALRTIAITGVGNPNTVVENQAWVDEVENRLISAQDQIYRVAICHTHSRGTITKFGSDYSFGFSRGDYVSLRGAGMQDPTGILGMMVSTFVKNPRDDRDYGMNLYYQPLNLSQKQSQLANAYRPPQLN